MNKLIVIKRKWIVAQVMFCVSMMLLAVMSIQYAAYVDRKSNQQWCGLVTAMDDEYARTPPATPTGIGIAEEIHKLRIAFECK
jgi:hypothetical protein